MKKKQQNNKKKENIIHLTFIDILGNFETVEFLTKNKKQFLKIA